VLPKRFPLAFQVDYEMHSMINTVHGKKRTSIRVERKQAIIWRIIIIFKPHKQDRTRNTCRGRDAYEQRRAGGVREVRSGKWKKHNTTQHP